jgi:hypothetical protein
MNIHSLLVALAALLLLLPACRKKETATVGGPPPPPEFGSSENNLGYLNEGVRNFQKAKQRLPNDLDELVAEKTIARIPPPPPGFRYTVDRATGLVTIQPGAPSK